MIMSFTTCIEFINHTLFIHSSNYFTGLLSEADLAGNTVIYSVSEFSHGVRKNKAQAHVYISNFIEVLLGLISNRYLIAVSYLFCII